MPARGDRSERYRALVPETMHEVLLAWYGRNVRDLPWRKTRDLYAILVSEVMLQQSPIGSRGGVATLITMRV
jgi:adenine-specific DNA glycosylase